jgi:hypothetical protein
MNPNKKWLWLQTCYQQDSLGEAVASKSSVIYPDEDRLDAGVSTARLQTKRLSAEEWKVLLTQEK